MDREKLYSEEVEINILGSMIIDTNSCIQVIENNINKNDFYHDYNKIIFVTIKSVFKEKNTIDLLMLIEELKNKNLLEKARGMSYISEIANSVASTTNLLEYLKILKEYSRKRKLDYIAKYISSNINQNIEELQQEITSLVTELVEEKQASETAEEQEEEYLKTLEKRMNGEIVAVKTGLSRIDEKIGGFSGGDLVTIFAFSGVGKTALATQIALNNIKNNKRVLFFSLEMPKEQVRDRIISNLADVPSKNLRDGKLKDDELVRVIKANTYLSLNKRLLISEEDELLNITSKIQLEIMKNNIDIIFIDYINLINITGNNKEEHYRVAECTRLLKRLAIKINKPIVILAQAKQEAASKMSNNNLNIWEKVAVNDVAGGASIYRDSDIVIGIYRNIEIDNELVRNKLQRENNKNIDYFSKNSDKNPECMTLLIKKSRASGKDIVAMKWKSKNYRISNWY